MSRIFKLDEVESKEDAEVRALDMKVEETLKMIAQASSSAPELIGAWIVSTLNLKADATGQIDWKVAKLENMDKLVDGLKTVSKELPNLSTVLGHWTATLSAYVTYRSLKKQESLTEKILTSNNRLAWATVILASATVVLAIVSANSVLHFWG